MTYLTTEQVKDLATNLHEGQFREDGKPYITHPIAVAELVLKHPTAKHFSKQELIYMEQAALLHDVIEDCGVSSGFLKEAGVDPIVADLVATYLTRDKDTQAYVDYITNINRKTAILVKISDLTHNLIGAKGNRKDKYELALEILEAKIYNTFYYQ
tara:strand:- start:15681 stop:16148 length:468 start_codon:yes stop_codon:yes gene_type:complete